MLKDMHYRNVQKYIYSVRRTVLPNRNFNLHKEIKSVKNEKMRLSVKIYTFFYFESLVKMRVLSEIVTLHCGMCNLLRGKMYDENRTNMERVNGTGVKCSNTI